MTVNYSELKIDNYNYCLILHYRNRKWGVLSKTILILVGLPTVPQPKWFVWYVGVASKQAWTVCHWAETMLLLAEPVTDCYLVIIIFLLLFDLRLLELPQSMDSMPLSWNNVATGRTCYRLLLSYYCCCLISDCWSCLSGVNFSVVFPCTHLLIWLKLYFNRSWSFMAELWLFFFK